MKVKEFIEILKQCDIEKELRFDFIELDIRRDSKEFKIREWANCVDILPCMPIEWRLEE